MQMIQLQWLVHVLKQVEIDMIYTFLIRNRKYQNVLLYKKKQNKIFYQHVLMYL